MKINIAFVLLLVAAASACGSGSEDSICTSPRGRSVSSLTITSLPGVDVADREAAFDGKLGTASSLTPALGITTITLSGVSESTEASTAGVLLQLPADQTTSVSVTTYKDGAQVDRGQAGSESGNTLEACPGICVSRGDQTYFGIPVSGKFDQLEVTLTLAGAPNKTTKIHELCS